MRNLLNESLSFFVDKWPILLAWNVCIGLLFYAYGCEAKTRSLTRPETSVTRSELRIELDTLLARGEAGVADLDKQEEIRNIIFNQGLMIAQGGAVNPVGVITTLMAVFGIGATADDIRLRKKIKKTV